MCPEMHAHGNTDEVAALTRTQSQSRGRDIKVALISVLWDG